MRFFNQNLCPQATPLDLYASHWCNVNLSPFLVPPCCNVLNFSRLPPSSSKQQRRHRHWHQTHRHLSFFCFSHSQWHWEETPCRMCSSNWRHVWVVPIQCEWKRVPTAATAALSVCDAQKSSFQPCSAALSFRGDVALQTLFKNFQAPLCKTCSHWFQHAVIFRVSQLVPEIITGNESFLVNNRQDSTVTKLSSLYFAIQSNPTTSNPLT